MIEYVEIRQKSDREIIGIIDGAQSIIWNTVYYGVGDFEIYTEATRENLQLLVVGNYVTRPDEYDDSTGNYSNIGVIEKIEITNSVTDGFMIVATGRLAKSILDRRHIYRLINNKTLKAYVLSGNVEVAVRSLVTAHIISSTDSARNISFFELGDLAGITKRIVSKTGNDTRKQVSYSNLLEFTDELLQEYGMAARVAFDYETLKMQYVVYEGSNRSMDNTDGNSPVIFSVDFDNLLSTEYENDESNEKNVALIGGEGEGTDRFYTVLNQNDTLTGIDRRETFIDASVISKTYIDDNEQEQTYSDADYRAMLESDGNQQLAEFVKIESFAGEIDVTGGVWKLNEDYFLGDIVTVQDNKIGKYADVRITKVTEVQDENGYTVSANYESE